MRILNLGCGGERDPAPHWVNLDDLHSQLPVGSGARAHLDGEHNYKNFVVLSGPLPFPEGIFDAVLASHFFEHFNAQDALTIMQDCLRILKPGGRLLVSVPCASYFRAVNAQDTKENWPDLFGVTDPNNGHPTWLRAAMFFEQHMQLFTEDSLWCHLRQAGYDLIEKYGEGGRLLKAGACGEAVREAAMRLNREKFSLIMTGTKPA